MNPAPTSIPSLPSLFWRDCTIRRAAEVAGFSLFAAFGIWWATQPVPSVVKVEQSPMEIWAAQWGPTVAVVVSALAVLVLVRRWRWVREVLLHGTPIKGTVEEVDVHSHEAKHSETTPAFKRAQIRTYIAVVRYDWRGMEKTARLKLPNSPAVYEIYKGREIDLLALNSAPDKPLIRTVYLGRL